MTSKAVEKAMHAYLISEAETEERRAQRLRAVAAALEESLANEAAADESEAARAIAEAQKAAHDYETTVGHHEHTHTSTEV
mmetsp:Transcript_3649/g.6352  ORF Transcript_3649/g.6352 Transcript_3649/m.6352 type:complete len:81 (+) Transcript_3649:144-386(+)|eukprot:CAMPEP_0197723642 /NCGR_PEP_ID=MMETSP1434-20131217/5876_1 /TAXON_ID=265543 /ORGANISM="Minutocellus polymorphus, Strain CCMP3303" /LENGTH=80 /DNA_ID=CAMNT_0043308923 /DNA_START=100 /DNA_END=342 /DNA_ORIENTATION=-